MTAQIAAFSQEIMTALADRVNAPAITEEIAPLLRKSLLSSKEVVTLVSWWLKRAYTLPGIHQMQRSGRLPFEWIARRRFVRPIDVLKLTSSPRGRTAKEVPAGSKQCVYCHHYKPVEEFEEVEQPNSEMRRRSVCRECYAKHYAPSS